MRVGGPKCLKLWPSGSASSGLRSRRGSALLPLLGSNHRREACTNVHWGPAPRLSCGVTPVLLVGGWTSVEIIALGGGVRNTNDQNADARGYTTIAPTVAGHLPKGWLPASSITEAEFLSLPRPRERCRFSNLSRTTLCELLNRGEIRGVTIRRPGAMRGKKLIIKKSLADYLYGLSTASVGKAGVAGTEVTS